MVTPKALVRFLRENSIKAGPVDRLKIIYRPLVCPFPSLIAYVNKNDIVADIGCGSGQFCLLLSQFSKPRAIYGYEISPRLVRNARMLFRDKITTEHHFEVYNGMDLPDEIVRADLVFLIDVLHHIPLQMRGDFLESLYAKIKRGARIVVKDIDAASPFVIFNKIHDLIFSRELVHENSLHQSVDALQKAGFHVLKTEKQRMYVYPHYTVFAKK
jgi:SAM-dependent methyltransferase